MATVPPNHARSRPEQSAQPVPTNQKDWKNVNVCATERMDTTGNECVGSIAGVDTVTDGAECVQEGVARG